MQKEFLLPNGFKKVGWVLFATSVVMGIWSMALDFDFTQSKILSPLLFEGPLLNNYIVIGFWLGAIFIACSREKMEDEMIGRIRLNALLSGFYLQAVFIIAATFVMNNLDYLDIMVVNLATFPFIFVLTYCGMLWHTLKTFDHGE